MAKKVDLKQAEELASKGYTVTMVCNALGISRTKAYRNRDIIDTIKAGHDFARQKVVDNLFSRSAEDPSATASIFLAKSLKVFDDPFPTSKPINIKAAQERIAQIYIAVSRNELDAAKGDHLVGYLEKFIKSIEITELEKRIEKLEGKL